MPRVKLFDESEVLTKAMNLFWKQGYAATSVQDLVSHLGINRASLYDTFGDKEQLFKKSFELYRKNNIEGLKQFFDTQNNVREGFARLFENAIEEAINDEDRKGCFVVNTTTELVPNDDSIAVTLEDNKSDFEKSKIWLEAGLQFSSRYYDRYEALYSYFEDDKNKITKAFGNDLMVANEYYAWAYTLKLRVYGCLENADEMPSIYRRRAKELKDKIENY